MNYLHRKILSTQKTIYIVVFLMFCFEITTSSTYFQNNNNSNLINNQLDSEENLELKNINHIDSKILSDENLIPIKRLDYNNEKFNTEEKIIIEYVKSHPELRTKKKFKEIKKIFKEKGINKSKREIEKIYNSLNKKTPFQ